MSNATEALHRRLAELSESLLAHLSAAPYAPLEGSSISVKFVLQSLLPKSAAGAAESQLRESIRNFVLASALLAASKSFAHELLSWIPHQLADAATAAFRDISDLYCQGDDERLVAELAPEVLLLLKDMIKESSIDNGTDGDEVSAASARAPVGFAILAAYQLRWFVTKVCCHFLVSLALRFGNVLSRGQGMICFIRLGKNVNAAEFGVYQDVVLDACCHNIASADEIWHLVVEMSVLLVSSIRRSNPKSH
ncbi:unnamed protein product [Linum tenue]|uniref:Uncharacterized protein n=1 Tax=Linum tenue TaxID=586396 RepID=A0AAV0MAV8_9ROSI|nr:unnamed protein product [Linum tenue]